ncbi:MAG TPA: NAD-dependent epimerase/dehydratase family protein [Anaerolineae bacterium]|nr:NAD-dependent epimerase/dehydratase family protein [Anaerolineae bacterium]
MRCLVTGGRGFVGQHLMAALSERGHEAISYDLVDGQDVLDPESLKKAVLGAKAVFHLAGILGTEETFSNIRRCFDVNVMGTLNLLDICTDHDVPLIVLSLTSKWLSPYMVSKQAANALCQTYAAAYCTPVSVVRGLNAYGPGQHWGAVRKVVPTFIVAALQGDPLRIYGDGNQIVDLIYVSDVAEIMVRLWESGKWGLLLDAGTGVPTRVIDLAQMVIEMCGSQSTIEHEAMRLGEAKGAVALADPTDALRELGYYPQVGLQQGLGETIEWYRERWREAER